jgi:hypothetical protein
VASRNRYEPRFILGKNAWIAARLLVPDSVIAGLEDGRLYSLSELQRLNGAVDDSPVAAKAIKAGSPVILAPNMRMLRFKRFVTRPA